MVSSMGWLTRSLAILLVSATNSQKLCALPSGSYGECTEGHWLQLAFVVDVTGSMGRYIKDVKENIERIVDQIVATNQHQLQIELAFVGYRDVGERHELLSFTNSVDKFKSFFSGVSASGGGDFPEDVLGGLNNAAGKLRWKADGTKLLFHIGDAPHHGQRFEGGWATQGKKELENKPRPVEAILGTLCKDDIDYYFLRIASETATMENEFKRVYDACDGKRLPMQLLDLTHYSAKALVMSTVSSVSQSLALSMTDGGASGHLSLRNRLETFYAKHDPTKDRKQLDALAIKYAEREDGLYRQLEIRYGTNCPALPACALP